MVSSHFEDWVPQFPVAVAVEAKQLFELEPLLVLRESVIDEVSRHDDARWRVYVSSTDGGRPLCFAVRECVHDVDGQLGLLQSRGGRVVPEVAADVCVRRREPREMTRRLGNVSGVSSPLRKLYEK